MSISQDQIKFLVSLVLSVPLSYFLRKIAKPSLKYVYSFVLGTALQFYVYGLDIWMPFLVHVLVYVLIKIKGRHCGAFITGISIFALSGYHIYRMIDAYGSWILDISTILMTMVCKYSLFAYAYQDGQKQKQKLTTNQQVYKLIKLPSIWQYLVYCQFLPTCIVGTAIQFKDFHNYMQNKQQYAKVPEQKIIPSIIRDFIRSLVCGGIYVIHMLVFPLSTMQNPNFAQQSTIYILIFSFFSVTTIRFKYYFGWKLSQCSLHASAISYNGQDNQFTRVQTCNPWIVQTTLHLRQKVSHWNMSSQLWLRRCLYQRSPFKNKQISQGFVIMVSAFWHGFYGGYYLSFFFWFLQINLSQKVFKFAKQNGKHMLVKLYESMGIFGYILLWIFVNFIFSHNGLYFQILDSQLGFAILKRLYFAPPLIVVFLIIWVGQLSGGKRSRSQRTVTQQPKETSQQTKTQ